MIIFSIICLVVILLGMQHLLNWMWRSVEGIDAISGALVLTAIFLIISFLIICYIIKWGQPLLIDLKI